MYEAYDAGDRARIDAALDLEATIWDSAVDPLLLGRTDLDRIRDARPAAGEGPQETGLTAYDRTVDVFEDVAASRDRPHDGDATTATTSTASPRAGGGS